MKLKKEKKLVGTEIIKTPDVVRLKHVGTVKELAEYYYSKQHLFLSAKESKKRGAAFWFTHIQAANPRLTITSKTLISELWMGNSDRRNHVR